MESIKAIYIEGEKTELTCEARGEPSPVVTWYKDGKVYTGRFGSRHGITPGEYDYNITFTGLDIFDRGTYICNVSNKYGWLTYKYTISVKGKIRTEPQIYYMWHQDGPVYAGEDVEIYCKVLTRDPNAKYRWYYSDSGVPDENNLGSLIDMTRYKKPSYVVEDEFSMAITRFTLKLENLTIEQSGLYGCQTENVVGNASRQTNLIVTHWPVIPVTTVTTDTKEKDGSGSSEEGHNEQEQNFNDSGNEKRENEQSWISSIQYPGAVIGMLVAALFIFMLVAAWSCWQRKKSRASRARGRPDIDSIHPRCQVKNEYVVLPDFNRG